MKNLAELERELDADLRRALHAVMPTLEDPALTTANREDADPVITRDRSDTPIGIVRAESGGRARWWLVSAAAAVGLLVGGLAVISNRSEPAPNTNATTPTLAAPADSAATTQSPNTTVDGSFPLDGLDPYDAAAMISLDARIGPTPDEQADFEAAGAILVSACLRDGGATPPPVTATEHQAFRDDLNDFYSFQTNAFTTTGLEFRRENGFLRDTVPFDANADTPLHLEFKEGSFEERLMIEGCGAADNALRNRPAEVALRATTFEAIGNRWYSLGPGELPEFADGYQLYDDCMSAAGYPDHDVIGTDNPYSEFFINPEYTNEERAAVNDDADCRISTDLPTNYVNALSPVLDEYDNLYSTEIAAIQTERDIALDSARATLIDNGIEPFTA